MKKHSRTLDHSGSAIYGRFVDLSISIEPDLPSDPPMLIPRIDYKNHLQGSETMKDFFPGITKDH